MSAVWCWCLVMCVSAGVVGSLAGPDREARLVATSHGSVRGYRAPQGDHFEYFGVPYATAPTGEHRFKPPLPAPVWLQTLEAVNDTIICPQIKLIPGFTSDKIIKEDCLLANIYVPDTAVKHLPVVVLVHGGAYQIGFGNQLTPKGLMKSKKAIAVTFNYRLGAHGFLCLGTKDAPGNAGMKDQVALLRWVKRNIGKFGGNPDDVTIAGSSAGGSSVELLMLSKMARGLFNKVIPESGASVGIVQIDPLKNAREYAKELAFENGDDVYALEEFYKNTSYEVLSNNPLTRNKDSTYSPLVFTPCVERNTGSDTFLDDAPVNIIRQGKYRKVPVLHGFTNMEGILQLHQLENWKDKMNARFSDFLPFDLQFDNDVQKEQVGEAAKKFYFGDKAVGEETVLNYIDYFSDVMFVYPALRSVSLQVAAGSEKLYLYEYSYPVDVFPSHFRPPGEVPEYMSVIRGARHAAQTEAVLDNPRQGELSGDYTKHKELMKELWLNFITTGNPVSTPVAGLGAWTPADEHCTPHAALGERMEVRGPLLEARRGFWDGVYARHYRPPAPPPAPPAQHTEL